MVNMGDSEVAVVRPLSVGVGSGAPSDSDSDDTPLQPLRRNKRKNFQPRNISVPQEEPALDLTESKRRCLDEPIDLSSKPPVQETDLREYAHNTVRELLQIYGLNSAEVAESITNNVPISSFSTGKILDCSVGIREPPTPPRTPQSPREHHQQPTAASTQTTPSPYTPHRVVPQSVAGMLSLASGLSGPAAALPQPSMTDSPRQLITAPSPQPKPPGMVVAQASLLSTPPLTVVREPKALAPIDYSRYVRRFANSLECGSHYCRELNYREHFHCLECNSRVFAKKEEMIRHFKWHKKRDESLQHGFMRYSPSDDCSDKYPNCGHNRKQTHYHCIQGNCDKVYISTSDVQMHANYHRKDSAIIQEGFQRLRATEECRVAHCAFFGQRTTHFHCRRDHCQFTFKNKADMEKHKTYHIKDEALARDGFKKFLKPDPCGFVNCRFSQVCNHIHCVREGCNYVLHSSGQLLSHKRKHERKDSEIAYRKFKLAQQAVVNLSEQHGETSSVPGNSLQLLQHASSLAALTALHDSLNSESSTSPTLNSSSMSVGRQSPEPDDEMTRYIASVGPSVVCPIDQRCALAPTEHYHCREPPCADIAFRCRETAEGHARMHEAQDRVSDFFQESGTGMCTESCSKDHHFHCTWEGCSEVVSPSERLEHFRSHEISAQQNNSLEALFRRKRGRPPKNRVIEVWNDYASGCLSDSPQAIFTSFKLPKPGEGSPVLNPPTSLATSLHQSLFSSASPISVATSETKVHPSSVESLGFHCFGGDISCPENGCPFAPAAHYHCSRERCHFAAVANEDLVNHSRDFHDNVEILEGFSYFDRSVDCKRESCPSNKLTRHFHCDLTTCEFSFVRYSQMAIHKAHHLSESGTVISLTPSTPLPLKQPSSPSQPTDLSDPGITIKQEPSPKGYDHYSEDSDNGRPTAETPCIIKSEPNSNELPEWMSLNNHEKFGPEITCSRPFCKLKRKEHYHCNACNQAFSELDKLKPHIVKHSPAAMPLVKSENNNNEMEPHSPSPHHTPHVQTPTSNPSSQPVTPTSGGVVGVSSEANELQMPPPHHFPGLAAMAAMNQQLAMMTSQGIPFMHHPMPSLYTSPSGLMFAPGFPPHPSTLVPNGLLDSRASLLSDPSDIARRSISPQRDMSTEAKKARVQSSMRMLKDEPVPEGYLRFRFNEDCRYQHCGYREHQTHFHCMRQDCGYSFCDKTRFVQHTARHERLDTLMGGDFQQYRANVSCGRIDCSYTTNLGGTQNKASHFHCLKCEFVCTDTNKVVAHRRQHQKLDSIMAAGFEKFTPSQVCSAADTCAHSGKQTHYHCLSCQYAVLGLSQMTAHKYRHMQ